MTFKARLRGAITGLLIAAVCLPLAFVVTVATFPFWRWLEETFAIEAYGHSGPSEWCYWVVYGILLVICAFVWSRLRRTTMPDERH
jgi:ribose/xylose/arabinose/galactoside ABC-type transport system permease subunit